MGNYHCCPEADCGASLPCGEYVQLAEDCPVSTYACQTTSCCDTDCGVSCTDRRYTEPECLSNSGKVCSLMNLDPANNLVAVKGLRPELDLLPPFKCCENESCGVQEMASNAHMTAQEILDQAPMMEGMGMAMADLPTAVDVDDCLEDHTKTYCMEAVSDAVHALGLVVQQDLVPTVAEMAITNSNTCVNLPPGMSDCSTLTDTPHICPTGICCSDEECLGGCYFGDYTECECQAMAPNMFVCAGIGKRGPIPPMADGPDGGPPIVDGDDGGKDGSMGGDPHIKRWNHKWFDFHGECDLVLLDAPAFNQGMGITIHVRTTLRYDYSYIELASVKIGNDILQVGSYGAYWFNEISNGQLPTDVNHTVTNDRKQSRFEIRIGSHQESIVLVTFKDMVTVQVNHANQESLLNSVGLMGQFSTGDMLARDNVTIMEDPVLFGQEWQVRDDETSLFVTTREPQYPTQCRMPRPKDTGATTVHRRLGGLQVSQEDAEEACARNLNVGSDEFKNCVFDTLASNDLELALASANLF